MKITLDELVKKKASRSELIRFEETFGNSTEVDFNFVIKVALFFDWYWFSFNFLNKEKDKEFKRISYIVLDEHKAKIKTYFPIYQRAIKETNKEEQIKLNSLYWYILGGYEKEYRERLAVTFLKLVEE